MCRCIDVKTYRYTDIERDIYIHYVVVFAMTMMLNLKSRATWHSTENAYMWRQRYEAGCLVRAKGHNPLENLHWSLGRILDFCCSWYALAVSEQRIFQQKCGCYLRFKLWKDQWWHKKWDFLNFLKLGIHFLNKWNEFEELSTCIICLHLQLIFEVIK